MAKRRRKSDPLLDGVCWVCHEPSINPMCQPCASRSITPPFMALSRSGNIVTFAHNADGLCWRCTVKEVPKDESHIGLCEECREAMLDVYED